jgi:hypothetical protein
LRRFAEEQIKEHGNGTADAWAEAVEEFEKATESVIGQSIDSNGAETVQAVVEPADPAVADTDY